MKDTDLFEKQSLTRAHEDEIEKCSQTIMSLKKKMATYEIELLETKKKLCNKNRENNTLKAHVNAAKELFKKSSEMKESKFCILMAKFKQLDADATTEKNELMIENEIIKEELKACQEKNTVLETKLNENYSHCKRLEEEKIASIDCITSTTPMFDDESNVNDYFCITILNLCKQVNTLEEKCNASMNAEKQTKSLFVQINDLKEKNSDLKQEIEDIKKQRKDISTENFELQGLLEDTNR